MSDSQKELNEILDSLPPPIDIPIEDRQKQPPLDPVVPATMAAQASPESPATGDTDTRILEKLRATGMSRLTRANGVYTIDTEMSYGTNDMFQVVYNGTNFTMSAGKAYGGHFSPALDIAEYTGSPNPGDYLVIQIVADPTSCAISVGEGYPVWYSPVIGQSPIAYFRHIAQYDSDNVIRQWHYGAMLVPVVRYNYNYGGVKYYATAAPDFT
ncbi:MAG: hypothetical protein JRL30_17110 [Deltaproteobacteria bacterium]|nr:hypothetical protein [Deltaproteobacteria bacterium]